MQMTCRTAPGSQVLEDTSPTKRRRRGRKIDFMISWTATEEPIKELNLVVYTMPEFGCNEYVASKRRRTPPEPKAPKARPQPSGTPRRYLRLL